MELLKGIRKLFRSMVRTV